MVLINMKLATTVNQGTNQNIIFNIGIIQNIMDLEWVLADMLMFDIRIL